MQKFIVTVERSSGNETVGDMWTETAIFEPTATLAEVAEWIDGPEWASRPRLAHQSGRVTLTRSASTQKLDEVKF